MLNAARRWEGVPWRVFKTTTARRPPAFTSQSTRCRANRPAQVPHHPYCQPPHIPPVITVLPPARLSRRVANGWTRPIITNENSHRLIFRGRPGCSRCTLVRPTVPKSTAHSILAPTTAGYFSPNHRDAGSRSLMHSRGSFDLAKASVIVARCRTPRWQGRLRR